MALFTDPLAVIKLKQVDHVNHERSILADVSGYPFITNLITSFSDNDSLYMLVSALSSLYRMRADNLINSLIFALAAKSSPTSVKQNDSTRTRLDSTLPKLSSFSSSYMKRRVSHIAI